MEERISRDSLSHQTARLNQKNSRLKARLSYSRSQYRSQLADARHMLSSRNAKVNQLRTALIRVRDLCHSIDSSYRVSGTTCEHYT
jgi:ribosomal protein S4